MCRTTPPSDRMELSVSWRRMLQPIHASISRTAPPLDGRAITYTKLWLRHSFSPALYAHALLLSLSFEGVTVPEPSADEADPTLAGDTRVIGGLPINYNARACLSSRRVHLEYNGSFVITYRKNAEFRKFGPFERCLSLYILQSLVLNDYLSHVGYQAGAMIYLSESLSMLCFVFLVSIPCHPRRSLISSIISADSLTSSSPRAWSFFIESIMACTGGIGLACLQYTATRWDTNDGPIFKPASS